jgi:hypothetical protein
MSQYNTTIVYIPSQDNTIADALSCVPNGSYPDEVTHQTFNINPTSIHAIVTITTDLSILHMIQDGYAHDELCKKLITSALSTLGISTSNGLWYIGN